MAYEIHFDHTAGVYEVFWFAEWLGAYDTRREAEIAIAQQPETLASAQRKARRGGKFTRVEMFALQIENDRLQDIALGRA